MGGLSGGGRPRLDVLVGTLLVMVAMIVLVILAGPHFGHTRTINFDLKPPQLSAANSRSWM